MQLMVENVALCLFKMIADARLEPVLSELLYYYERDEARHVGLGALALPTILPGLSAVEAGRLWLYQLRVQLLLVAGGLTMRDEFSALGIDQAAMQLYGFELQRAVHRRMGHERADSPAATRGLFKMSRAGQDRINRFLSARIAVSPRRAGRARPFERSSRSSGAATTGWPRAPDPPGSSRS